MKNILLIGIGGTGAHTAELLQRKIKEYGKQTDNRIATLLFDTDAEQISSARGGLVLDATDSATVGTVCDRLGHSRLSTWFPAKDESVRAEDLHRGSAAWRKKALLCLHNMLNDRRSAEIFHNELERFAAFPFAKSYDVYFVGSLAGGTGAGLLLPLALYTKRFLSKFHFSTGPRFYAMLSCPDIYADNADTDNATRYFANAYAALRELNAINLVAHGYNGKAPSRRAKEKERKNDPAIFRLESPNPEEVSGVLFDASEEKFQKVASMPFRTVYLLDRIAGVRTVAEHEEALADSLYTLTCTKAEGMFDNLTASADTERSLQHGAGAVYAALSAAKLSFPREHILRVMAQKKTVAVQKEWTAFLAEAAEDDGGKSDFPHLYISAFREAAENADGPLAFLREEWQQSAPARNGARKAHKSATDSYLESLSAAARRALPAYRETIKEQADKLPDTPPSFAMRHRAKQVFVAVYKKLRAALLAYEEDCRTEIPFAQKSLASLAFGFNAALEGRNAALSSVLFRDEEGKALHPLIVPLRLAFLKDALHRLLSTEAHANAVKEEKEDSFLSQLYGDSLPSASKTERKSAYARLTKGKENRLEAFFKNIEAYLKTRTNPLADAELMLADVEAAFDKVQTEAAQALCRCVYRTTEAKLDALLSSYQRLFSEWSDAAHRYKSATEDTSRKSGERNRNTHTILASFEEKEALYTEICRTSAFENQRSRELRDQKAGEAVLSFILEDAEASYYGQPHSKKAATFFRTFLAEMENDHLRMLENSNAVAQQLPDNILTALELATRSENGELLSEDEQKAAMRVRLSELFHAANPPLRLNTTMPEDAVWKPGDASVVMISEKTADYIAEHADFFEISDLPDDAEQDEIRRLAADRFVKSFISRLPTASVAPISDDLLYVANGKTNIEPVRIKNLDEMSDNPIYYNGYKELLRRMQARENDHYNPHLHFLSHARALLPFINPEAAKEENSRVLTALLYAVLSGEIALKDGKGYTYREENGKFAPMTDEAGAIITEEKLYLLIPWMRAHTAVVERLLSAWESTVAEERQLSASVSPTQFSKEISKNRLLKLLRDGNKSKTPYGILEFASAIKKSEETNGSDYDAAENLLAVGFDMFLYGFALRRNPSEATDAEADRYSAAIDAFWSPFSDSERTGFPPNMLINWVCRNTDVFCDIDKTKGGYRYKPHAFEA